MVQHLHHVLPAPYSQAADLQAHQKTNLYKRPLRAKAGDEHGHKLCLPDLPQQVMRMHQGFLLCSFPASLPYPWKYF